MLALIDAANYTYAARYIQCKRKHNLFGRRKYHAPNKVGSVNDAPQTLRTKSGKCSVVVPPLWTYLENCQFPVVAIINTRNRASAMMFQILAKRTPARVANGLWRAIE